MKQLFLTIACCLVTAVLVAQSPSYVFSNTHGKIPVIEYKGYHYVSFEMDKKLTAYLTLKDEEISSYEISPRSKKVQSDLQQRTVFMTLEEPGYYMVRINNKYKFFIFAEKPSAIPSGERINILDAGIDNTGKKNETQKIQAALDKASKSRKLLYFPAGEYKTFPLTIKSNTHIYLDKDAVIKADAGDIDAFVSKDELKTKRFIYLKDAENVRISGLGRIDGNGKELREKYGEKARMRLMLLFRSKNVEIDGLRLSDPGSWNTQILCSENVSFRHVKLLNDIGLSNTDGFDPDASKKVTIEDCFAYCSDDNVAVKITDYSGFKQDVEDITVRGCVFLTKKSSLKVGTETRGNLMKNILFENNDVLESDRGMAIYVSDGATLENVRYINNRFERNHPDSKRCGIQFVVQRRKPESRLGFINDVLIKDCSFEESFPRASEIKSEEPGHLSVAIDNLRIAGKKCITLEEMNMKTDNAEVTIVK